MQQQGSVALAPEQAGQGQCSPHELTGLAWAQETLVCDMVTGVTQHEQESLVAELLGSFREKWISSALGLQGQPWGAHGI